MSQQDPSIIYLKIDKNHLVETGFMEQYNNLLDTTVFNAYLDSSSGLLTFQREKGDITIPFNLTGLTDVNVDNSSAGQILSYDGTNWIAIDGGGAFDYVRTTPSSRFTDILSVSSVVDALDKILYPYEFPSISTFSIQGLGSFELGQYVSSSTGGNNTFQWSVSKIDNIDNTYGYTIVDNTNSYTLKTGILPKTKTSEIINIPYGIVKTIKGATNVFTIQTKNTQGTLINRSVTYTWNPRIFWGVSATSTLLSNSEINALASSTTGGSKLASSLVQQFTMNGGGKYIWIAMPVSFGLAINSDGTGSRFVVGGLANSAWELFTTVYTNQYSHTEGYYLYRTSTVQFGSGIDIKIV